MFAECYRQLESLRTGKGVKENMISKQNQEMQIIITQVQFGEGVSGKGKSISKTPKPKCKGE